MNETSDLPPSDGREDELLKRRDRKDAALGGDMAAFDAGAKVFDQNGDKYDNRELHEAPCATPRLETPPPSSRLVTVKGGSEGPVLVIVPGIAGKVDGFRPLARLLKTPKTIYVIRPRGFDGSARVEDMARRYLEEVRIAQPTGPYYLCGHSLGGLVAFEMARMLIAAEEQVAALILLATTLHKKWWPLRYFVRMIVGRAWFHVGRLRHMPVRRMTRQMEDVLRGLWMNWVRLRFAPRRNSRHMESAAAGPAEREIVAGVVAWTRYRPRFYPGKLIYFYPNADGPIPLDPGAIWRSRACEVEVHNLPGGHVTILSPPHLNTLASDLDCYLARLADAADAHRSVAREH
jgi:thioesterase domain-containing protein